MAAAVDRLARQVLRLKRQAVEMQALATDLAEELAIVRRILRDDASGRLVAAIECAILKAAEERRKAARRAAVVGAHTMEMRPVRGGSQMVRIDRGDWFRVTRKDATLLRVLTTSSPVGPDGFAGWMTPDEVAELMGQKTGVPPTRHALSESVYRIRKALRSVDLNEYLLAVDRAGRLRFRLRVGRQGSADPDPH